MATMLKPEWSKPTTILFASEIPADEKAFAFALAQACEFGADLTLFHAYDTLAAAPSQSSGIRYYDYAAAARSEMQHLEPLAERARAAGLRCEVAVRPGLPADQILSFAHERKIDRIVMGTHTPGPVGKLLIGSVAEVVLRSSPVPVCIVGPHVVDGSFLNFATRTVLCAVSMLETSEAVVTFAAELAAQHNARLILQHVIKPQERNQVLANHTIDDIEAELVALVPVELQDRIQIEAIVVPGDPTEELLYQGRTQQADVIVLGAQGASTFAAISRHGMVYKVLAQSQCPVMTLSPTVLARTTSHTDLVASVENFLAGVF